MCHPWRFSATAGNKTGHSLTGFTCCRGVTHITSNTIDALFHSSHSMTWVLNICLAYLFTSWYVCMFVPGGRAVHKPNAIMSATRIFLNKDISWLQVKPLCRWQFLALGCKCFTTKKRVKEPAPNCSFGAGAVWPQWCLDVWETGPVLLENEGTFFL